MSRQFQRRTVLAGAAKATAVGTTIAAGGICSVFSKSAVAQSRPTYQSISFDIHGGGQKIGELVSTQNLASSGKLVVQTNVEIVSNIYTVAADNEESWEAGTLTQVTGVGQNNGTPFQFLISGTGEGLAGFDSRGNDLSADQDALPTTYWNRDFRQTQKVINTVEGNDFDVRTTELGRGSMIDADGNMRTVEKVRVRGRGFGIYNVVLGYDSLGDWSGLEFSLFGFDVSYRRRS